jgi:hypothetical protein
MLSVAPMLVRALTDADMMLLQWKMSEATTDKQMLEEKKEVWLYNVVIMSGLSRRKILKYISYIFTAAILLLTFYATYTHTHNVIHRQTRTYRHTHIHRYNDESDIHVS